jgi:predicted RNase H-like nuclease (RuvC/YqgF family)
MRNQKPTRTITKNEDLIQIQKGIAFYREQMSNFDKMIVKMNEQKEEFKKKIASLEQEAKSQKMFNSEIL